MTREPGHLPVTETQLNAMTRDLAAAHNDTLAQMTAQACDLSDELIESPRPEPTARPEPLVEREPAMPVARRMFLTVAGGTALAFGLAACGGGDKNAKTASDRTSGPASPSAGGYTGDFKVVALAAALENQAVGAYQAALNAAQAGKLGTVPPAVSTFVKTAMGQHADHAKAWNSVLQKAGKKPVTGTPLKDQKTVTDALGKVTDVTAVAKLALQLEDQAAQTYLTAMTGVTSKTGIAMAATIAPVEAMHSAILRFILGQYPVPDDFIGTGKAAKPSQLTA
ncbi:ferritin-like domain-containing protein [Actinomadura opuntiae]|uniref:ferritin-like domain-containing protein n=1 Tax=Actinomadura sp. OS1-43 TaxID=604315 RepID=UPI00255AA826|nr:ferritin-like domain-containing protein [Actinomadura sp. OS1-43]MDL4818544.1 ferritin-like domain-containing protein [Actinomadura sp. OS1-43]